VIVVADSGSTKTDWIFTQPGESPEQWRRYSSQGLNPFYVSTQEVKQTVENAIPEELRSEVTHVYFYGAGCSSPERNEVIALGLIPCFPENAHVEVDHDLLAAARASCHNEQGVVSILGTGSNSCMYDGDRIVDNVANLGFMLGDEGSGGHIGKELVRARCYREMPEDLAKVFDDMFGFDKEVMLHQVYHRPLPNRYMASFAPFAAKQEEHPFIQALIKRVFAEFVDRHLMKYDSKGWPHHFIGSIASIFEDELDEVLSSRNLKKGDILKHPVDALLNYHIEQHAI